MYSFQLFGHGTLHYHCIGKKTNFHPQLNYLHPIWPNWLQNTTDIFQYMLIHLAQRASYFSSFIVENPYGELCILKKFIACNILSIMSNAMKFQFKLTRTNIVDISKKLQRFKCSWICVAHTTLKCILITIICLPFSFKKR